MNAHVVKRRIGRWAERLSVRFAVAPLRRIAALLKPGEDPAQFVRMAVESELMQRQLTTILDPGKACDHHRDRRHDDGAVIPGI